MALNAEKKSEIVKEYQVSEGDTGSPRFLRSVSLSGLRVLGGAKTS